MAAGAAARQIKAAKGGVTARVKRRKEGEDREKGRGRREGGKSGGDVIKEKGKRRDPWMRKRRLQLQKAELKRLLHRVWRSIKEEGVEEAVVE